MFVEHRVIGDISTVSKSVDTKLKKMQETIATMTTTTKIILIPTNQNIIVLHS